MLHYTLKDTNLAHLIRDESERVGNATGKCELGSETVNLDKILGGSDGAAEVPSAIM